MSREQEKYIIAEGVRTNNLKNINVRIPLGGITVISGLSGSGKSSLAFDTIYAEAHNRMVESFTSYVRQFLPRLKKPPVDRILNLTPCIALPQKLPAKNSRSTVATVTSLLDFIKLLFARAGEIHDPKTGKPITPPDPKKEVEKLIQEAKGKTIAICVQFSCINEELKKFFEMREKVYIIQGRKLKALPLAEIKDGFLAIDIISIEEAEENYSMIYEAVETGMRYCGEVDIFTVNGDSASKLKKIKTNTGIEGVPFEIFKNPDFFSYTTSLGACKECGGRGVIAVLQEDLIVGDPSRPIGTRISHSSAIKLFRHRHYIIEEALEALVKSQRVRLNVPYSQLTTEEKAYLWLGDDNTSDTYPFFHYPGLINLVKIIEREEIREHRIPFVKIYQRIKVCNACKGNRLRKETDFVKLNCGNRKITISELLSMPVSEVKNLIEGWFKQLDEDLKEHFSLLYEEINIRLTALNEMGLEYLTLNRSINTLSTGEFQRVMISGIIGAPIACGTYILDEPTVGLHPANVDSMLRAISKLKEKKCTVIMVEHDLDVLMGADYVIELGEKGGHLGGKVLYQGPSTQFFNLIYRNGSPENTNKLPPTLKALHKIIIPDNRKVHFTRKISIKGARTHNLKNIDVVFPCGLFTVVCGVSGSGKSSLVIDTLYNGLPVSMKATSRDNPDSIPAYKRIELEEADFSQAVLYQPNTTGISSRTIVGTYLGFYDHIRQIFASTPAAVMEGIPSSHFSINTPGGRCEECEGMGYKTIEMLFLSDIEVKCDACNGKRFKENILEININGKNINDILDMTIQEAIEFFSQLPSKPRIEQLLEELNFIAKFGLDYIRIGQPLIKMSGGEIQRIKLISNLMECKKQKGHDSLTHKKLIILDEPTTGLHYEDVFSLLDVISEFTEDGHTVIVIEHHPLVILNAHYVIELGPGAGDNGGKIVFQGHPSEMLHHSKTTPTAMYLKKFSSKIHHLLKVT